LDLIVCSIPTPDGYIFALDRGLFGLAAPRLLRSGRKAVVETGRFSALRLIIANWRLGPRLRISLLENRLATTISTLMACMRTDRSNAELLAVVADLARRFSATVIGVAAKQLSLHPSIMTIGPGEPRGREFEKFRERADAVEAEFRSALSGVEKLQWRAQMSAGPASQPAANEARAADLIVAAIETGGQVFSPSPEIEVTDLLMRAGRPILIAPPGATGLKLTRALVCWKDSREARRAVADALPILKASKEVEVVELAHEGEIESARVRAADVGDWLHRHGIEATCVATPLKETESTHLAAIADDIKADLIVAGAFGHSRLREWAFGGVTRDLLVKAERCTLVSH
jgi:nucleotide-binding universal stress UspA family protein